MRFGAGFACVIFSLLMNADISAQSLVMQLPEDGMWATYRMTVEDKAPDGRSRSRELQLTVRVVEKEGEGDSKRRWIEIEKVKPGGERIEMTRFSIAQADIGKNLTGIVRDFEHWRIGGSIRRIANSHPFSLEPIFAGNVEQVESLDAQKILTAKGEFECVGIRGASQTPPAEQDRTTTYTCYRNPEVPFGSVKFSSETLVRDKKKHVLGTISTVLLLEDWGTGAESSFP